MAETDGAVSSVARRPFKRWEAYAAKEAFLVGSTTKVMPIAQWDQQAFGHSASGAPPVLRLCCLDGPPPQIVCIRNDACLLS